jgi:hypothetical protein
VSNEKYFKRGTVKCPKDGTLLDFEVFQGMRIARSAGNVELFQARCSYCKKYWGVLK